MSPKEKAPPTVKKPHGGKKKKEDIFANIKQEDLAKVGSLGRECWELKDKYDACFNDWFAHEFLKGKSKPDMVPCKALFKDYQACVKLSFERLNLPPDLSTCIE